MRELISHMEEMIENINEIQKDWPQGTEIKLALQSCIDDMESAQAAKFTLSDIIFVCRRAYEFIEKNKTKAA